MFKFVDLNHLPDEPITPASSKLPLTDDLETGGADGFSACKSG